MSVFPGDVLDYIFDLIESVSEGFPTYYSSALAKGHSDIKIKTCFCLGNHLAACIQISYEEKEN